MRRGQVVVTGEQAFAAATGCGLAHAVACSLASSASRSAMARSNSGERLAHCSGGKGCDHSTIAGSVRSGGGGEFFPFDQIYKQCIEYNQTAKTFPQQC